MSVITKADEELKSAYTHIDSAVKNLAEILVQECWGAEDLGRSTREDLQSAFQSLLAIRAQLK